MYAAKWRHRSLEVDSNKLWHDVQNEETVICAKFGTELFNISKNKVAPVFWPTLYIQESPAIADKPARRESLPKIAPIRRAYNVVAANTGLSSFV